MEEIITIKCPDCGKVLQAKYVPGIEDKMVKCVVCKRVHPFRDFKAAMEKGGTEYGNGQESTSYRCDESPINVMPGRLVRIDGSPASFNLKKGINIIGRRASSSTATIQIDTKSSRRMSRSHFQIEVKMVPGKGLVHYMSLYKEDVNTTCVNGSELLFGDTVILKDGDVLTLPDATLKFTIPDEEGTEL